MLTLKELVNAGLNVSEYCFGFYQGVLYRQIYVTVFFRHIRKNNLINSV